MTENKIVIKEPSNKVVVSIPGPQGAGGRTILNGVGAPSNNLGLTGDFYYNTTTTDFYGPKLTDGSWSGATIIKLFQSPADFSYSSGWEIAQVQYDVKEQYYYIDIYHNLGFFPNVTVQTVAGDILETGIKYYEDDLSRITLTMAQPFGGTAYLS